jgi:hypothetical protein
MKVVWTGGPKVKKQTVAPTIRLVTSKYREIGKSLFGNSPLNIIMRSFNEKRSVNEDLGMHSRVIQEKPVLPIIAAKYHERARKLLLRLRKEVSGKVCIFSDIKIFVANALVNCCNSRYLTDLPMSEVNKSIKILPFSKAPLKVIPQHRDQR